MSVVHRGELNIEGEKILGEELGKDEIKRRYL
jgi:hypothetical protein